MAESEISVFEIIGGKETIWQLVDDFYTRVENDPQLRAIFPEDLEPGKQWQYLFLMQYWGGPTEYAAERGHPRLRMRHAPFAISSDLKDRWVMHMHDAIDAVGIQEPARSMMREYFQRAGEVMVNRY